MSKYFLFDSSEFVSLLEVMMANRRSMLQRGKVLAQNLGADTDKLGIAKNTDGGEQVIGFRFSENLPPGGTYRKEGDIYIPRNDTDAGKEVSKKLSELPKMDSEILIQKLGLENKFIVPGEDGGPLIYPVSFFFYSTDLCGVRTPSVVGYEPPLGVVEVSKSDLNKMIKQIAVDSLDSV